MKKIMEDYEKLKEDNEKLKEEIEIVKKVKVSKKVINNTNTRYSRQSKCLSCHTTQ